MQLPFASIGQSAEAGSVSLVDALKTPEKFTGQKACWLGKEMASGTMTFEQGRPDHMTIWMASDANGVATNQSFVTNDHQIKRTEAAEKLENTMGDSRQRFVCGTITGSMPTMTPGGVDRKIAAPVLDAVTLDAPPEK